MDSKMNKSIIWSFLFLIVEILLTLLFKFIIKIEFLYIGLIGVVYILINAFCVKYHRERLFVNGIISFFTVAMMGVLFSSYLEVNEVMVLGAVISIFDVISFTSLGKKTMNSKAMSNGDFMAKLIVYGKGKGDVLYPTCGIGDYFYFSIWLAGLSRNIAMVLILGVGLLIGNLINKLVILKLSKKQNYKGLPATIVPFVFVVLAYFVANIS